MSVKHAQPNELIDIGPLGARFPETKTTALVKTGHFELLRLVLPKGKGTGEHKAPGEIIVQCLEGRVTFSARENHQVLSPGQMLFLEASELHAVEALEDSSLLITFILAGTDKFQEKGK